MNLANENHIVMVDDNPGDLELAQTCCAESNVENPWLAFTNGKDFFAYLQQVKHGRQPMPALVLLDINMPGMSGLDVLRETRRDGFFETLPIFCMLTSSTDPRDKQAAEELGVSTFVTKPDLLQDYVRFFDTLL
jgi:CheY-like chemotaxis protein